MAISFTPKQQQVIDLRDKNILVSAAAGSGKTAVLVERIVNMVCDEEHPVDIDRLLVVTFTKAAAAEMRERVGIAIEERLQSNPTSTHIQKQVTLVHNAQITTIDSFSLFILRNHFHKIGLDPAFRAADEGELKLMKQSVLEELLEEAYGEESEEFLSCVEFFCPGNIDALGEYIEKLATYAESFPWPMEWLEERKGDYKIENVQEMLEDDCAKYLLSHLQKLLSGLIGMYGEAIAISEEPGGPYMYGELLEQEMEAMEGIRACEDLVQFSLCFESFKFDKLPGTKDDSVIKEKREKAQKLRNKVKDAFSSWKKTYFAVPFETAFRQTKACEKPMEVLLTLTQKFLEKMAELKKEKKLVDFSDMEHYALDILWDRKEDGELIPSSVAMEYRQFFHEVLIDEYQDSNLVQEYLLMAVAGESDGHFNRFMVGDIKQSIYKFRLARPELFLEKYETYKEEGNYRRIDLSQNFRSRKEVIDSVNEVFTKVMSRECGDLEYDENAMLYLGADYPESSGNETELYLVEPAEGQDKVEKRELEAAVVGKRILELMRSQQVYDKAEQRMRPASFRDMVILLRSPAGMDEDFKNTLENMGIPVYITSKTGYFAATEVQELLNVLRVLNNPMQDIPLFGVLKSIFGGFTDEEIAKIRGLSKEDLLYKSMTTYLDAEKGDPEIAAKVGAFLEWLASYREKMYYLPIRELLQTLLEEKDYLNYVTALPGGTKRRGNVEMLLTRASDFEKTSYFGLFHFVRYMEQLEKYDVDAGEADLLDENADVVRIMSIHKSKGLEFPITFVCGLGKQMNMSDLSSRLLTDADYGIGVDYFHPDIRVKQSTFRKNILAVKLREGLLAEELRILYVAMTRAKEKLIMTGIMKNATQYLEEASESDAICQDRLDYFDFYKSTQYLHFLLPIIGKTSVQIFTAVAEEEIVKDIKQGLQDKQRLEMLGSSDKYMDVDAYNEIERRFARVYPYKCLENLYTKTTVSELKIAAMADKDEAAFHTFEEKEPKQYIPVFRKSEEVITGSARGNAYHKAMEILDFDGLLMGILPKIPADYEEYKSLLDRAGLKKALKVFLLNKTESKALPMEYFEALRPDKIVNFMASELGYRMWLAQKEERLYREQPFVLGIEASRVSEEFPKEEKVLIQGIIDVFFVEEGEIVLLDYKTDKIESMEALWNRYEVQLDYYGEALERLMDLPVKERILYSFSLEEYR